MKDKASGLPKKYVSGLSKSTAKARAAHWKKMAKYSDRDPRAYEPAPGDATAKTKPSKYTRKYKEMFGESAGTGLAAKANKSGVSLSTLRKVYRRGVAAWNSGHRPGTTPQQWGMARVNSYITKGKTYHTADKDLREQAKIAGTNCKNCIWWTKESEKPVDKSELNEYGGLKAPNQAYIDMSKHADLITLPGKMIVKVKAYCNHEEIQDFVTERMCCAYWDGEGVKREFKGTADIMEEGGAGEEGTTKLVKKYMKDTPNSKKVQEAIKLKKKYLGKLRGKTETGKRANAINMKPTVDISTERAAGTLNLK